ncbi:MAG: DEAD/DEAH box helicase, partial [Planctomycetia bacterium]|nr:DEAD/DEAH box helicase [Planctomycetia bacterium]
MLLPADILGRQGTIAARLPHFELRSEQLAMAEAVAGAIERRRHLVVEAGTGVGKTFAYLVPAILAATSASPDNDLPARNEDDAPRRRVVVSTHTISLQEQLIAKDLPLLKSVIPRDFSAVLVKGRRNYLSLRRLAAATERATSIFHLPEEFEQLRALNQWVRKTADGSLADLAQRPLDSVWDEAASDSGNCLGRNCPQPKKCFYFSAQRLAQNAEVLVVNHALFFSDLALRRQGVSLLPDYDVVIFDEAHNLESVASQHLGLGVTSGQVEYMLNKLYNDRTNKGLLKQFGLKDAEQQVDEARLKADDFFDDVRSWCLKHSAANGRVMSPECVPNPVSPVLLSLSATIKKA